ncbi:MAG: dTDP-glucose 4,6-dehydratase [Candidatus Omnitrophota bacterium]|nr:dTDP-glucose 4,6-dehydratase [Candidatus Omnitrophota bacterium]
MKKQGIFKELPKMLVTGGLGFIGSEFVRQAVGDGYRIIVIDKITYAGDTERLRAVKGKYKFYKADICDKKRIDGIFKKENPDIIAHFAAETHVDRSIRDASIFLKTNCIGTQILLDLARKYKVKKLIHISSDEVYGDIEKGKFNEDSPLKPNSPYAASKAAADLLIKSYIRTYGFPAIIIRPSNNYGPWQYPEKFIPVVIYNALKNNKVPVYAKGLNRREWLYVEDCARGILLVLKRARSGEIYNIGSGHEERNIDIAKKILAILGKPYSLIKFIKDRPGHDWRYFLDSSKIRKIGWKPKIRFEAGIRKTVKWNKENTEWLQRKSSLKEENNA